MMRRGEAEGGHFTVLIQLRDHLVAAFVFADRRPHTSTAVLIVLAPVGFNS